MRRFALAALTLAACGVTEPEIASPTQTDATTNPTSLEGNVADQSCQVVLRQTTINFESRAGPQTDCSSGTCWVIVTADVDVSVVQDQLQSVPHILYQGASGTWHSVTGTPVFGTAMGYRSYQIVLNDDTFLSGNGANSIQLIPYLQTYWGAELWDHNRNTDPGANYQLIPTDNWTIMPDATVCPAAAPAGTETLTFPTSWQNTATGTLVPAGKLDVNYEIYRLSQSIGCSTDGVWAFSIEAQVQFQPGGSVLTELINGPVNADGGGFESLPLEFDVPSNATSAALWFSGGSECEGASQWDSNFGQNYVYQVTQN